MSDENSNKKSNNDSAIMAIMSKVLMIAGGAGFLLTFGIGLFFYLENSFAGVDGSEILIFLAVITIPFWIWIPIIEIFLFGVGLFLHFFKKEEDKREFYDKYIKDENFKTSEINADWDKGGTFKCPFCGREQDKNTFECIYCHHKI